MLIDKKHQCCTILYDKFVHVCYGGVADLSSRKPLISMAPQKETSPSPCEKCMSPMLRLAPSTNTGKYTRQPRDRFCKTIHSFNCCRALGLRRLILRILPCCNHS